ncbi:MAG: DNA-3-methyladenine glycosylase I [Promethearchaeota archaeon]
MKRCTWSFQSKLMLHYHDHEWGVPQHEDLKLFEMLCLQSAQAGLNWQIILEKRENYRKAFDFFVPEKIVNYKVKKIEELLHDRGIIRNRLKIESIIHNAGIFLKISEEFGTFNDYVWSFVDYKPIQNSWQSEKEIPGETPLSKKISKDMKNRGFKFIGSKIIYAFMQATGIVNDHVISCFRYEQCKKLQ